MGARTPGARKYFRVHGFIQQITKRRIRHVNEAMRRLAKCNYPGGKGGTNYPLPATPTVTPQQRMRHQYFAAFCTSPPFRMELSSLQPTAVDDKWKSAQPGVKNRARFHFSCNHRQGMKVFSRPRNICEAPRPAAGLRAAEPHQAQPCPRYGRGNCPAQR